MSKRQEVPPKPLILYVDDEPDSLGLLKVELSERGYAVLTALSTDAAFELLKSNTPDLILTDLRMQPLNGFDFLSMLRKDTKLAATPVIFLTAIDDLMAHRYGEKLGISGYVTKPVDLDELTALIRKNIVHH